MSRSGTTLFAPSDVGSVLVKKFYMDDKETVLKILTDVMMAYEDLCESHKPGKSGIARKQEFELVIENMRKEANSLAPSALLGLCRFYEKHHGNGRLGSLVESALMKILRVSSSLDLKTDGLVPVVTSANILSLASFWNDQSQQLYTKLNDAITRIKKTAGVVEENQPQCCVIL